MINEQLIREYELENNLDALILFKINTKDKKQLEKRIKEFNTTISTYMRILVKESLKE
jgi:hypothetical protein